MTFDTSSRFCSSFDARTHGGGSSRPLLKATQRKLTMLRRRSNAQQQDLPLYAGAGDITFLHNYDSKKRRPSAFFKGAPCCCLIVVVSMMLVGALVYYRKGSSTKNRLYYGIDLEEHCKDWTRRGECQNNRMFMLSNCPESCHVQADISIDSLLPEEIYQDAVKGFAYFLHSDKENEGDCRDDDAEEQRCEDMAQEGKCLENSEYMLQHCPKSCLTCFGSQPTTVTIDFGVSQTTNHEDPSVREEIQNVITKTRDYMVNQVFVDDQFTLVRRDCRNLDENCSLYSALGECHGTNDALQMFQNCAPACQACNAVEHYRRCARRPEDVDVFLPGDMNAMFARILSENPNKNTILSQPVEESEEVELPWIIVLDDYLSNDECDWLIAKGNEIGFRQTSEITDEIKEDGTFGDKVGQGRTSLDAWCERGCEDQPVGKAILQKMLNTTGMKLEHTEFIEILKYNEGGHYERHHDMITTQGSERCGNRILSLYVFLSDVEDGGELRFTEIEKQVTPQKGRAVLWQNVMDDALDVMQTLTFHEALPVKRGKKYGMNLWFHSRNMREAMESGCC